MSMNRAALLSLVVAALPSASAFATGSTCSTTCTPGAVQCDASGNVETCVQQGAVGSAGCTAAAELVYVVDVSNTFSSFTPGPPATFNDLGTLNCPDFDGTPFSMSVDRSGTAWIIYSDGELFKVDIANNLACTDTGYSNNTWSQFGMGFVTDTSGGTTDSLFIANVAPLELGTMNTSTLGVTKVGSLSGSPELTGNSLAQLWGFFPDSSHPRVSELSKTTGAEGTSFPMSQLAGNPDDWAFAFYGGDFYVFLQRDSDNSTNVWHLNGTTGAVDELLSNTGREIVGAGESTCVPAVTCYGWNTAPCPSGDACTNGVCVSTCTNRCTAGATQCDSSGNLQTCAAQTTGCTDWNTAACPTGDVCSAGACVPSCANRCTAAAVQCSSTGDVQTCDLQSNGCYDWDSTACPTGEACTNGVCASTCTNACTAAALQCSGSIIQTCTEEMSGCTGWENGTDCGAAGCMNGACCPCVTGSLQCDSSGNLERCQADVAQQACPSWVTIPCTGGTCFQDQCFQDCNPNQEIGSCPGDSHCVSIPDTGSSDLCSLTTADGGYESPTPIPTTTGTSSGTTAANGNGTNGGGTTATNAAGTNANGANGTTGGTNGGSTGAAGTTGGTNGGTVAGAGASGSTGSHPSTAASGAAAGGSTGSHVSGTGSGSTGSTGSTAGGNKAVAAAGCGCQSGTDLSGLSLLFGAALFLRNRRRS